MKLNNLIKNYQSIITSVIVICGITLFSGAFLYGTEFGKYLAWITTALLAIILLIIFVITIASITGDLDEMDKESKKE